MENLNPKPKTTAKDFFLYLGSFVAFYTTSISFIWLVVAIISNVFTDELVRYSYYGSDSIIRNGISTLIIALPVFILLSWLIAKDLHKDPSKGGIWIRKWLTYLTLFVAGITVAIDLITFVNRFLDGEITTRFVLNVLTVFVVALLSFLYYFWELRKGDQPNSGKTRKIFTAVAVALVLFGIVYGMVITGSPAERRMERFDNERVSDLQGIQRQVVSYWQKKQVVPTSLEDIHDSLSSYVIPVDPSTKEPYEYTKTGELSFELCATFSLKSKEDPLARPDYYSDTGMIQVDKYGYVSNYLSWDHTAGRNCFEREIDPDLYKLDR